MGRGRRGLEQGVEAAAERVGPVGDRETESLFDLGLIENRICRSLHRARESLSQ